MKKQFFLLSLVLMLIALTTTNLAARRLATKEKPELVYDIHARITHLDELVNKPFDQLTDADHIFIAVTMQVAYSYPKPPPNCGTDSNGVKYCCNNMGVCWPENWTPQ